MAPRGVIRLRCRGKHYGVVSRFSALPKSGKRWVLGAKTASATRRRLLTFAADPAAPLLQRKSAAMSRWWEPPFRYGQLQRLAPAPPVAGGARRRRPNPAQSVADGGRIFAVTCPKHVGLNMCVDQGRMTVAVCHSLFRRVAAVGDVVLFIAGAPRQDQRPPAFGHALRSVPAGRRLALGALRVDRVETAAAYQRTKTHRLDRWYRPCRGRERAVCSAPGGGRFTLRHRARFGPGPRPRAAQHRRNLSHNVPSGTSFWRSDAHLLRAPLLPRTLANNIYGKGWSGRGMKRLQGKGFKAACAFLRGLAAADLAKGSPLFADFSAGVSRLVVAARLSLGRGAAGPMRTAAVSFRKT